MKFEFSGDYPLLYKRRHIESKLLEKPRVLDHGCSRKSVSKNNGKTKSQLFASFDMGFCNIGEFAKTSASNG